MDMTSSNSTQNKDAVIITGETCLRHWQGHRSLTRRLIEVFPEDKLFTYSLGGMRPYSDLVLEFVDMAVPGLRGIVSGKWDNPFDGSIGAKRIKPKTKQELLQLWDEQTEQINDLWQQIPPARFHETEKAFGQWDGPVYFFLFYWIDNEVHHRGQAYVYLRSLGIEPPAFWDRPLY